MPKSGSRENGQPEESAPISLPSTYTGEPLMPCATPRLHHALARWRARGSGRPRRARPAARPTISASNVLDRVAREHRAHDGLSGRAWSGVAARAERRRAAGAGRGERASAAAAMGECATQRAWRSCTARAL